MSLRVKLAAVQAAPVYLDRKATVAKVVHLVTEAAAGGANVIVFPEAFIPAYPDWIWRVPTSDGALQDAYFQRWLENAVEVPGPDTEAIGTAARQSNASLFRRMKERVPRRCTLYDTI